MTTRAPVTPTSSQASLRSGSATSGRTGPSPSLARSQVTTATQTRASAESMWQATTYGLRPHSTVIPPSTALLITTQNWAQPSLVRPRRQGLAQRAARMAQPTAAQST